MIVPFLKAKIHRATVTEANLEYQGSVTIGSELLEASGIVPFEQVQIYNITNGERFTTYAMAGSRGTICINGAAAWKARPGDLVIIASYCMLNQEEIRSFKPNLVYVGKENEIKAVTHEPPKEKTLPGPT